MTEKDAMEIIMQVAYDGEFPLNNNEAFGIACKALEKQIPMKPKAVETDMDGMDMETGEEYTYKMDEAHCINCNSVIGNEYDRFSEHYCDKCGQKIDWSEWE